MSVNSVTLASNDVHFLCSKKLLSMRNIYLLIIALVPYTIFGQYCESDTEPERREVDTTVNSITDYFLLGHINGHIRNYFMTTINNGYLSDHYAPVKIDADKQIVYFKQVNAGDNQCVVNEDNLLKEKVSGDSMIEMPFDMLHLAPPQVAPDFVRNSELVNDAGWLDVDIHTLQHKKYKNVFGIGDVAALPTAKTGAAIRKQVPVVIDNLKKLMTSGEIGTMSYNGYSSCPLVTGYGKMVLAEFDYDGNFTPDPKLKQMLIKDSSKEHLRLWWLKKYMLPYLYWNKMLKGKDV